MLFVFSQIFRQPLIYIMEDIEIKNEYLMDIKNEEIKWNSTYELQEPLCEIQGVQCATYEDATDVSNNPELIENVNSQRDAENKCTKTKR